MINVEDAIRSLVTSADLGKVLESLNSTPADLMALLRSPAGRRQLSAMRTLGSLHSGLLAAKFGPFAVHRLVEMLSDEKPDVRLKGAQELIKLLGITPAKSRAKPRAAAGKTSSGSDGAAAPDARNFPTAALLEAIAEVLERPDPPAPLHNND